MSRPARPVMPLLIGALCGILWWAVSWAFGARAYGIWGTHLATGAIAGIVTGIAITAVSTPMYRRISSRGLYWYSPLSVYAAIAIYGLVVFALRHLVDDFAVGQKPWAVGLQSILGMWWGVTVLVPIALTVQVLAWVLRRILTAT